jgi:hypothetical protein
VPVRFELSPSQAEPEPLKALKPFEFLPHRAGTLRLPVPRSLGVLRVAGAEGYFRRADGRRLPADGAAVGEGGELTLRHGRAPVLAWVQEPTQLGPWPAVEGPAEPVGGPMSLPLAGPRRLAVALPGPAMLSLYAPAGTAIEALPTEGMAATTLDGRLDVWLPQGRGEVTVRPSGTGSLEVDVLEAIELADGVGPTHLFAPGESRLYHFITHRTAPVGVGIQGEVDRLRATLRNPRGSVLADGRHLHAHPRARHLGCSPCTCPRTRPPRPPARRCWGSPHPPMAPRPRWPRPIAGVPPRPTRPPRARPGSPGSGRGTYPRRFPKTPKAPKAPKTQRIPKRAQETWRSTPPKRAPTTRTLAKTTAWKTPKPMRPPPRGMSPKRPKRLKTLRKTSKP